MLGSQPESIISISLKSDQSGTGSKSKWHKIQIYVAQDPDPFGRGSRSKWHEMRLQVAQDAAPSGTGSGSPTNVTDNVHCEILFLGGLRI